jgi:fumarate hydratase class I
MFCLAVFCCLITRIPISCLFSWIEFFDEFVYAVGGTARPSLRADLGISYGQVGILLSLPAAMNTLFEPTLMLLGDTRWRKQLVIAGWAGGWSDRRGDRLGSWAGRLTDRHVVIAFGSVVPGSFRAAADLPRAGGKIKSEVNRATGGTLMHDLTESILELIRLAATNLPPDVEAALRRSIEQEAPGSAARGALDTILKNVELSRQRSTPICQDTGTPIFYVRHPKGWSTRKLRQQIETAVVEATRRSYLRPNSVDSLTEKNTGNNLGDSHFPTVHFEEVEGDILTMELILKGGGCENVGAQYSLPDSNLGAGRDLAGVRKAVLDAVQKAQGQGCSPGILGVAIGGDRGSGYLASKEVLYKKLDDANPDPKLAEMETRLTNEANQLGIGPMGFGGKTTVLGTKITGLHRLPASYFVTISYMCWAYRRRKMVVRGKDISYA